MASRKVTITLDEDLADAVSAAASEAGIPVSRLIAGAAERELRLRIGRGLLTEWQAENGPFTPEEIAAVTAELADADAAHHGPAAWDADAA
jgi:hypothetical protein